MVQTLGAGQSLITGWRIARSEGMLLLAGYAGYIVSIVYRL